jgi:hypothetical protein
MTFRNRHPLSAGGGVVSYRLPGGLTAIALAGSRAFPFVDAPAVGPPLWTLVQAVTGTNTTGTSIAVTLGAAPTPGNLLVCRGVTNDPSLNTPAGWTLAASGDNVSAGDTSWVMYRVAQAGDSATLTLDGFAGNTKLVRVEERHVTAGFTVSLDQSGSSAVGTSVTTITAGTSGTLADANEFACAAIAIRALTSSNAATAPFSLDDALNNASAFSGNFLSQITTATTAVTPTSTWTTAGDAWGCFATFQATAGFTSHATTGISTGGGARITGSSARKTTHATTGVVGAGGSQMVGASAHTRFHTTSGALSGTQSRSVGLSARTRQHTTTGVIANAGARVTASANRTRQHATTGVLRNPGARVTATSNRTRVHAGTGVVVGAAARLIASAFRTRAHASTAVLAAVGAIANGSANRTPGGGGPVTHATNGVVAANGATVTGSSVHKINHATSGAIKADGAKVAGASQHRSLHVTSGVIRAAGAVASGAAARATVHTSTGVIRTGGARTVGFAARKITHATTGAFVGHGSIVVGIQGQPSTAAIPAGKSHERRDSRQFKPILLEYKGKIQEFETQADADKFLRDITPHTIAQIETKAKRIVRALERTGSAFQPVPVQSVKFVSGPQDLAQRIEFSAFAEREFLANLVKKRLQAAEESRILLLKIDRMDSEELEMVAALMMMI